MYDSILVKSQAKGFRAGIDQKRELLVTVRWDDQCGNRHNSLGVTGELRDNSLRGDKVVAWGCIHDEIEAACGIPQAVKDLIPFHLCSSDEPMHYVGSTRHLAGNRDCWGRAAGQPSKFDTYAVVANSPIKHRLTGEMKKLIEKLLAMDSGAEAFVVKVEHEHDPKFSYKFAPKYTILVGDEAAPKWYQCAFDIYEEAIQWMDACLAGLVKLERVATEWSVGKERELKAARSCAVADWPVDHPLYLSDAQLCDDENLEATLKSRLPALMAEMKRRVEAVGLVW